MPQGIICISPITAFKDTFDLTIDPALIDLGKLKDALLLPNRYIIERVHKPIHGRYRDCAEITVSSPDISEVPQGEALPNVTPCYLSSTDSDNPKTYTVSLQDILINGVSAIREEDKERKRIKEIKDVSVDSSARDTRFSGFAKLLMDEMLPYFGDFEDMERIIAQRACALVKHTINNAREYCLEDMSTENILSLTPDLTEWPSNP